MEIYIARGEERNGPYSMDSIRQFLADGELDGTELAWHGGLDEWIDLNEMVNGVALDKDEPAKGQAEVESEPLDEATLEQVNKIKAEAGDAMAQNNLGVMYDNGRGVEQDLKEAVKWYQKPVDHGHAKAQSN